MLRSSVHLVDQEEAKYRTLIKYIIVQDLNGRYRPPVYSTLVPFSVPVLSFVLLQTRFRQNSKLQEYMTGHTAAGNETEDT